MFDNLNQEEEDLIYDIGPTEISYYFHFYEYANQDSHRKFLKDFQQWKFEVAKSYLQRARGRLLFAASEISGLTDSDSKDITSSHELVCLLRNSGSGLNKFTVQLLWLWNCWADGNPYNPDRPIEVLASELQRNYPANSRLSWPGRNDASSDQLRSLLLFLKPYSDSTLPSRVVLVGSCHSAVTRYISALKQVDWLLSIVSSLPSQ